MDRNDLVTELRDAAEVEGPGTMAHLLKEAADVLEEDGERLAEGQGAVPPMIDKATTELEGEEFIEISLAHCGNCGALIEQPIENDGWNYCPNCGRAVKWDG